MRISDWSSDVCSSDLNHAGRAELADLVAGQRLPVALVLGRHVAADRGDTEAEQTRCFRGRDDLVVQCRGDVLGDAMKRLPARIRRAAARNVEVIENGQASSRERGCKDV